MTPRRSSIADIDRDITFLQSSLPLYPRSHSKHINCVYDLAEARWCRYKLSRDKEDIDKFIVHCTEAIFLPPLSRDESLLQNIFTLLLLLAMALIERFEKFEQSSGVKYSVEYLRYLHGLHLDPFGLPRDVVTASLIQALATQARLGDGDGTRNIKEMLVLCRELLTLNLSAGFHDSIFLLLARAVNDESDRGRVQSLDPVIEWLRDVVKMCLPVSRFVFYALASALRIRFEEAYSNDDLLDWHDRTRDATTSQCRPHRMCE